MGAERASMKLSAAVVVLAVITIVSNALPAVNEDAVVPETFEEASRREQDSFDAQMNLMKQFFTGGKTNQVELTELQANSAIKVAPLPSPVPPSSVKHAKTKKEEAQAAAAAMKTQKANKKMRHLQEEAAKANAKQAADIAAASAASAAKLAAANKMTQAAEDKMVAMQAMYASQQKALAAATGAAKEAAAKQAVTNKAEIAQLRVQITKQKK